MKTITINASTNYDIHIGSGLLPHLGAEIQKLGKVKKICIVSDTNVFPLYGKVVSDSLEASSFEVVSYIFSAGEDSKNAAVFLDLLNFLADNHLSRMDLIVALGGGVTGDLAGFAAATYLRGIRYVQMPTTLLAAVDSSVGGKTGIDLPAGKNLAGAFYQPSLVICDTDTLSTLPEDIFRDGCAEVIKYAVLFDPDLFAQLQEMGIHFNRELVIARCIQLKKRVVEQDERESGIRMKLNFGHTIGHAAEAGSNYALSHGKAVSIGMAVICNASARIGFCEENVRNRILSLLQQFGLPLSTEESPQKLFSCVLSDKKRNGDSVNLILPKAVGHCEIVPIPVSDLLCFIEAGLVPNQ